MDIMIFVFGIPVAYMVLMLCRNEKVYRYRRQLIDRSYNVCNSYLNSVPRGDYDKEKQKYHEKLYSVWKSISDIPYDEMLHAFWKPLKDEYWLTKEQVDFLNLKF